MTLEWVDLSTNSAQARPLLVLRHGGLPLMVASTYDFDDFYDGVKVFGRRQRIIVEPCGVRYDGRLRCYIHPAYPGTKYSTGAAKPGIWYIGVYNDFEAGGATMTDYTLTVTTKGGCSSCADGFRDTSNACQTLCPGMIPEGNRAYSNAPTNAGLPCVGRGICAGGDSNPHCHCQPGYFVIV